MDILDRLSCHYFEQREMALCISYCQKILLEDNCREDAHRRLMRCYLIQGQRYLAIRQYHICVEAVQQELEVPPMPATTALFQEIQTNATKLSNSSKLR
jgi:DNA-binding SARP family transcriptional activator